MRVFVSYRRNDSPFVAGRLRECLVVEYGAASVFFDVDTIPLGRDFREHLRDNVDRADAVVALVGPGWDAARLHEPNDFVRYEILHALEQRKPVVPVLVADTPMPTTDVLPAELEVFAYLNAIRVRPDPDFRTDVERLIHGLGEMAGLDEPADGVAHGTVVRARQAFDGRVATAHLEVDGERVASVRNGESASFDMAPGRRSVQVTSTALGAPGYRSPALTVDFRPGAHHVLHVRFRAAGIELSHDPSPEGAAPTG